MLKKRNKIRDLISQKIDSLASEENQPVMTNGAHTATIAPEPPVSHQEDLAPMPEPRRDVTHLSFEKRPTLINKLDENYQRQKQIKMEQVKSHQHTKHQSPDHRPGFSKTPTMISKLLKR